MNKEHVKYEVDPYNRLVLIESCKATQLPKFRQVLEGRFKLDKKNNLTYIVKKPLSKDTPHQVKLKGKWALTKDNDLLLTLDKFKRESLGDKLTLKGQFKKATKDSLDFSLTTKSKENTQSTYIIKLNGKWQADKYNQLTFNVRKEKGKYDILTLKGSWQLDKKNQVMYTYKKSHLIRKQKKDYVLAFRGYWNIKTKKRISYSLDKKGGSGFDFKASFSQFRSNYIKYKVGIKTQAKSRPKNSIITLFGQWRIKKGLGLVFEVKNKQDKPYSIKFQAEVKLTKKDTITLMLKDTKNKPLEAKLELNHRILAGEGETFIRFLKSRKESAVFIGAGFGW